MQKRVEQETGEEQQGLRKGRGKTDGIFASRKRMQKIDRCRELGIGMCGP